MHDNLAEFFKDDLTGLVSLAVFAWGILQWRIARREASKTKQAEAAATFAVTEQARAERERDELRAREASLWEQNNTLRDGQREEINELKSDIREFRELQKQIKAERDAMELGIILIKERLTEQEQKIAEQEQKLTERDALKAENTRLRKRVSELEKQVDDLQVQINALRVEVKEHPPSTLQPSLTTLPQRA